MKELNAPDPGYLSQFGSSASVSGDTAVIAGGFSNSQGAAYVFVRNGGVWTLQQEMTGALNEGFGASVSVNGDTAVIGAYDSRVGFNNSQGSAYVFVRTGTTWIQQAQFAASDGASFDRFGALVSLSGNTAICSSFSKTTGSNVGQGAVYLYSGDNGIWT